MGGGGSMSRGDCASCSRKLRADLSTALICLHELGLTEDARRTLLDGPECLRSEAVYYYNLGCYQTQLGDLNDAKRMLKRSFEMDAKLEDVAKADPDLQVLWDEL